MSISLLAEPVRATSRDPELTGGQQQVLVMGFIDHEKNGTLRALILTVDGEISRMPVDRLTIDFRYDVGRDRWIDTNAAEGAQDL